MPEDRKINFRKMRHASTKTSSQVGASPQSRGIVGNKGGDYDFARNSGNLANALYAKSNESKKKITSHKFK